MQLSEDGRHLVAHCERLLHVFDVPAEQSAAEKSGQTCEPRARRPFDMLPFCYYRDRHILAPPADRGPFWVFDLDLRPLWQLHSPGPLTNIYFVGDSLFVACSGRVYDWRQRRRYIGNVDCNVPLWLNRR